ncbi:MAG: hypothetical protein [Cressdnaviricota sp.]|nr:MAG: hypothetical protein [Cressdnaviricota sp.]
MGGPLWGALAMQYIDSNNCPYVITIGQLLDFWKKYNHYSDTFTRSSRCTIVTLDAIAPAVSSGNTAANGTLLQNIFCTPAGTNTDPCFTLIVRGSWISQRAIQSCTVHLEKFGSSHMIPSVLTFSCLRPSVQDPLQTIGSLKWAAAHPDLPVVGGPHRKMH